MSKLEPKDPREAVAVFRAEVIGALLRRDLSRGELQRELFALSQQRFRPPGSEVTRTYSVPTLQRWYYRYRQGGLSALLPVRRRDRGHARGLSEELRRLLLDIRQEHPTVSAALIRDTLIASGRLEARTASVTMVQRLYREHDLLRQGKRAGQGGAGRQRLRWEAAEPMALWHGDVCHGPALQVAGQALPLRIHALLDDASRYVVALEAHHTERELDMLGLLAQALRRHGRPDVLYLDNGSTYSGEALATACARLGIGLVHAQPYDPQARGKMERFWRTLRERCLDHVEGLGSRHEVQVRLYAFLDQDYHRRPHAGLLGRSPEESWRTYWRRCEGPTRRMDEEQLRTAFTERTRRRVRRDSTLSHDGIVWELDQGYLAGRVATVAHCLLDDPPAPWVEHEDRRYPLHPVDPKANAGRRRERPAPRPTTRTDFDPAKTLLDRALGRNPRTTPEEE
jgi:putative transposase